MSEVNKVTVSLVLGSGGARGLAHIGIIRWLEEHNFQIESISGCSIGALIGGIYAAGKLDEFEIWIRDITKRDIINLLDISWKKNGLVKGERIINALTEIVGDVMIEDLPIKYTAIAADIVNEKEVWMNSGRLFDAVRASISLPLFFVPFKYKDIDLIDGGVLNPVPIAPTFSDTTDFTLAVNLGGKMDVIDEEGEEDKSGPESISEPLEESGDESDNNSTSAYKEKLVSLIHTVTNSTESQVTKELGAYDIASQAFDAMQGTIARQKLAAYPPDYFIEIARNACGTFEFNLAAEMIELGYTKAQQCLDQKKISG